MTQTINHTHIIASVAHEMRPGIRRLSCSCGWSAITTSRQVYRIARKHTDDR